jgi:hypothetical protein
MSAGLRLGISAVASAVVPEAVQDPAARQTEGVRAAGGPPALHAAAPPDGLRTPAIAAVRYAGDALRLAIREAESIGPRAPLDFLIGKGRAWTS